jgi:photosystem II stability/assembly factor-like uncharacterized protein
LNTKVIYEGYNQEGIHSRSVYVSDSLILIAGKSGVYSIFDENYNQFTDSLVGSEDIRDVHVAADGNMYFLNSGDKGIIWRRTPDSTKVTKVYNEEGVFLDGFAFWDDGNGIAYGDPVDGKFVILVTSDSGYVWRPIDYNILPYALPNEGGFAASGTGINVIGNGTVYIGTGMADTARLYVSHDNGLNWDIKATPIKAGDSYGIYTMYFWSKNEGIIVGGSYLNPDDTEKLCFYTNDGGESWEERSTGLGGYTSCIHGNEDGSFLVATGRVGTYYSLDKGVNWKTLFKDTFYTVRVTENRLVFSGKEGKIRVLSYSF